MKERISHFQLSSKPLKCRLCPGEQEWKLHNNIITRKMLQNNWVTRKKRIFCQVVLVLEGIDRKRHLFWEFLKTINPDGVAALCDWFRTRSTNPKAVSPESSSFPSPAIMTQSNFYITHLDLCLFFTFVGRTFTPNKHLTADSQDQQY